MVHVKNYLLDKIWLYLYCASTKRPSKIPSWKLYNKYYVTCVGPIENSAASSWKQQRDALEDLILFSGVLLSCLTKSSIFPSSTNKGIFFIVVSIKRTGCNKRTGWAEFFHLLHEKRVQGGAKNIFITWKMRSGWGKNFKIVKQPCSLNRYYRVHMKRFFLVYALANV